MIATGVPLALIAAVFLVGGVPGTNIKLTVPYVAQGAGPTFNTLGDVQGTPVIDIEGAEVDETSGTLDMTTVSVRTNMSMAQALSRWIIHKDTIVPLGQIMPKGVSDDEMRQINEQAFVASEAAATVAAMRYLGEPTRVLVHGVLKDAPAAGVLEPADVLTKVAGREVTEPQQVQNIVREHTPGETIEVEYLRNDEPATASITLGTNPEDEMLPLLGVTMTSEPAGDVTVNYNLNDIGGPSAGMIFSLAVIDKLSPGELNGGRKVAGTGTIAEDGTVGPIGGITHKIEGARDGGAELFLAPEKNCAEARKADAGNMTVASVTNIDDAISAMEDFAAGRPVTTCAAD
ncbi:PDZ domain-containing protein [Corynebacterium sp. MSK044]|uniref:YlbL family protein n=1 Tax=Corynebacterium sp. MSK044 TaxID=3050195 RepID=UPI00254DD2DF|nr:PDZ domain-containing protein [Corynebacterium sp. MSK044]MDK8797784.1 PDZ domain-containing protein [Corynebacterium sp. MSK044]